MEYILGKVGDRFEHRDAGIVDEHIDLAVIGRLSMLLEGIDWRRKNWLFAGSKAGGERAAAIYTVIETCKLNGVEPQAYIADVIAKIAGDWPASLWDELMPWNWRIADQEPIAQAA